MKISFFSVFDVHAMYNVQCGTGTSVAINMRMNLRVKFRF